MSKSKWVFVLVAIGMLQISIAAMAGDLTPSGVLSSGLYYSPDGSITTAESGCTIAVGRNVAFVALSGVTLSPGFIAEEGSIFAAKIATSTDSDGDGIPDWYEVTYNLNPTVNDAGVDSDGDGRTNYQEYQSRVTDYQSQSTTYNPQAYEAPIIATGTGFTATPSQITNPGEAVTLAWNTTYASSCSISPGIGSVSSSGTRVVNPTYTTTYTLTAVGPGGTVSSSATVTVQNSQPKVTIQAMPDSVISGTTTALTWESEGGQSASINYGVGAVALSGTSVVTVVSTSYYVVTVTNAAGGTTSGVTVEAVYPLPVVTFTADPIGVESGGTTELKWTTAFAYQASIDQGIGNVGVGSGVTQIHPAQTTTYTLTATGMGGVNTANVTVYSSTQDSDEDGLPDWWEIKYLNTLAKGPNDDSDGDLMSNLEEYQKGFRPNEYNLGDLMLSGVTIPTGIYTSGVSIVASGCTVEAGTDVLFKANGDIVLLPEFEVKAGAEFTAKGGDRDWLPDQWEIDKFNSLEYADSGDPDKDKVTNREEYVLGTDPKSHLVDSDNDGIPDWWELAKFGTLLRGANDDQDMDGINNYVEYIAGSDPNDPNSKPKPGIYYEYDAVGRIKKIVRIH